MSDDFYAVILELRRRGYRVYRRHGFLTEVNGAIRRNLNWRYWPEVKAEGLA